MIFQVVCRGNSPLMRRSEDAGIVDCKNWLVYFICSCVTLVSEWPPSKLDEANVPELTSDNIDQFV